MSNYSSYNYASKYPQQSPYASSSYTASSYSTPFNSSSHNTSSYPPSSYTSSSNGSSATIHPSAYLSSTSMNRGHSHASSNSTGSSQGPYGSSAASSPPSLGPPSPQPPSIEVRYAVPAGTSKTRATKSKQSQSINQGPEQFVCLYPGCSHVSTRSFDLDRHYKTHKPKDSAELHDCPGKGCGRTGAHGFSRRDHLTEHLRNYHAWDIPKGRKKGEKEPSSGKRR